MHDSSQALSHGHAPAADFEEHGTRRSLSGLAHGFFVLLALCFSFYQLTVAAFHPLSSLPTRAIHVGFLLALAFVLHPFSTRSRLDRLPWHDLLLGAVAFAIGLYHWIYESAVIQHAGDPTQFELAIGVIEVALLFEATRRIMGWALPLVCAIFLAYGLFGQYLPGDLAHRGYDFGQIVNQLFLGGDGIYGTPTLVSATYIFLFILFGAFLEQAGMINLFNNFALGLVGSARGGPAKVAVVSSGFMGTISGSGVANVLTVGQFTIPLMKRYGYSPAFAGAVEATASMGGQIMPPVMGAVAFIMAETLNLPYSAIVKAAVLPALLYYFAAFAMVHLEALRRGLKGLPKDQCPNPWQALRQDWYLVAPLAVLVAMLFHGFTPMYAGLTGLALTAVLILGVALAARIGPLHFRILLWIAIGLSAAAFRLEYNGRQIGVSAIVALVAVLVLACSRIHGGQATLHKLHTALVDGARQAVPVGLACAIVGVIIGVLTLTGAATSFAGYVVHVGEKSLILSLVLTMLVCLVLGMGIPTIPNYIITSSIAAPALLQLGVPLIVSHMFVFYFGIMADLTPPVALAAFAASSIAKAPPMQIGLKATQIAIAGFTIPFIAVYDPALMLQGNPGLLAVIYIVFKCVIAILLWAATVTGHALLPLRALERVGALMAAVLLVAAAPMTDEAGFSLAAAFFAWQIVRRQRLQRVLQ
ncbi:TRAP transporter permease [Uliginosibacterium paludis]|uniref:TRAP transporter permease n=1 Tax=Uliginosibacterium paludis TaxID=1615952 RepID=A0ABV2CLV0_9RHOO